MKLITGNIYTFYSVNFPEWTKANIRVKFTGNYYLGFPIFKVCKPFTVNRHSYKAGEEIRFSEDRVKPITINKSYYPDWL